MRSSIRIAVLETDQVMDQIAEKHGQYTQIFTTLLESGAESLNDPGTNITKDDLKITGYEVVTAQKYPHLEDIDAILITGSSRMRNIRKYLAI